jgi:hypothetical protein
MPLARRYCTDTSLARGGDRDARALRAEVRPKVLSELVQRWHEGGGADVFLSRQRRANAASASEQVAREQCQPDR